jgi:hypothetical protein
LDFEALYEFCLLKLLAAGFQLYKDLLWSSATGPSLFLAAWFPLSQGFGI